MGTYYIRQNGTSAQGPFEESRIADWIEQGRVREDMEFSRDGRTWRTGHEHRLFVRSVSAPPARSFRRSGGRSAGDSQGSAFKSVAIVVVGLLAWVWLGCVNEYFFVIPAIGIGIVRAIVVGEGIGQGLVAAVFLGAGSTAMRSGSILVGVILLILGLRFIVSMLDPAGP